MNGKTREETLQQAATDKLRLGLPLLLVREIDNSLRKEWEIVPPLPPEEWNQQIALLAGSNLYRRYRDVHRKWVNALKRNKEPPSDITREFYDLIADDRISGFIHSQKRSFIIDAAALLGHLIARLGIVGPVLDVGCHTGYHTILLAQQTGLMVHGIDLSGKAIDAARRKTPVGVNAHFDTANLEDASLRKRFDFVYAVDSAYPTAKNLAALSQTLKPDGVLMLINNAERFLTSNFRRGLSSAGLGFGLADVTGGWRGEGRGFDAKAALVLIKGTERSLPQDLEQQMKEGWEAFSHYANDPETPWDEKTQAFFRGHHIDTPPLR